MQGGKGVLFMKKLLNNLPFRLLLGIVIGIILGQVFPLSFMRVVVTLQYIMGQLITFCVPLIIIGFIAPSITKLGKNASRLLGVAVVIAYVSSICAAFMSTGAGYALIPHLSIDTEVAGLRELPGVVFELNIPQIMSVMSALVLSVLIGLAATWTNSSSPVISWPSSRTSCWTSSARSSFPSCRSTLPPLSAT